MKRIDRLYYWRYEIALIIAISLGIYLSLAFFYGPSAINGDDNFVYADLGYLALAGDWKVIASSGMFGQRFFLISGIALFYRLFGLNRLGSAIFGVMCFALTIISIYILGDKTYNKNAGIIAALVYSFNPIAVTSASYVGDNGPMALFITLSVMLLIMGLREKDRVLSGIYLILSGFIATAGFMVTPEAIIDLVFLIPATLFYTIRARNKKSIYKAAYFAIGIALGIGLMVILGIMLMKSPLYEFSASFEPFAPSTPQLGINIKMLFGYNLLNNLNSVLSTIIYKGVFKGLNLALNLFLDTFNASKISYIDLSNGLYGYFGMLAIVYLILRKNKAVALPSFWFISTFLYLCLGTSNPLKWTLIGARPRYMLIFIPALTLLIGIGISDFLSLSKKQSHKILAYASVAMVLVLLFSSSFVIIKYVGLSQYRITLPEIEIASFLNSLPKNATIFEYPQIRLASYLYNRPVMLLGFFTSYSRQIHQISQIPGNCDIIPQNAYVVLQYPNKSIISLCNLTIAYSLPKLPGYLKNYSLLEGYDHYLDFDNASVFIRKG
ncbi:MAG: glycosyltransferase family 39 protein [Candidatus Micrarchaeia archaeon]